MNIVLIINTITIFYTDITNIILLMDDDVFFIPDSISIMSKIKDPIDNRDNELSRIIR